MNDNMNISAIESEGWIKITDAEFKQLSELVYNKLGINLTNEKRTLLAGRLQKHLRQNRYRNFHDYIVTIINDKSGKELSNLANYITTNHTFFYREKEHFDFFQKKALPELVERLKKENSRDIRIWDAGCSSGEEPYMLVMLMMEYFGAEYPMWQAGILATDISEKALNVAINGIYPEERLNMLPELYKKKYFKKLPTGEYQIDQRVRKEVTFRRLNLMNDVFPFKKQFHIIFCRNVMIYFDQPTREKLVNKYYDNMIQGGYLFIGHSETLGRENHKYNYLMPALYQK